MTLQPILSEKNRHRLDADIYFFEQDHRYEIIGDSSTYTSVTTWNHSHFPKFDADEVIAKMIKGKSWKPGHKYWGLTAEQIKAQWEGNRDAVAGAGTNLHFQIECFYNAPHLSYPYTNKELLEAYEQNPKPNPSLEWSYFLQFVQDHPHLLPYRTEWYIYDEDSKIAGSIDMVFVNPDGSLSIYDWKRSKEIKRVNPFNQFALPAAICHLPDSNFWHYAMQLNTYKYILETKYGYKVKELFLVRLHPDAEEKTYELIQLPDLSNEVNELMEKERKNQRKTKKEK